MLLILRSSQTQAQSLNVNAPLVGVAVAIYFSESYNLWSWPLLLVKWRSLPWQCVPSIFVNTFVRYEKLTSQIWIKYLSVIFPCWNCWVLKDYPSQILELFNIWGIFGSRKKYQSMLAMWTKYKTHKLNAWGLRCDTNGSMVGCLNNFNSVTF